MSVLVLVLVLELVVVAFRMDDTASMTAEAPRGDPVGGSELLLPQ